MHYDPISNIGAECLASALKVNTVGFSSLGFFYRHPLKQTLIALNLTVNDIGTIGAQCLGAALQVNTVESHLHSPSFTHLQRALQTLESLDLCCNHIGDVGAQYLGDALRVNSVRAINSRKNELFTSCCVDARPTQSEHQSN